MRVMKTFTYTSFNNSIREEIISLENIKRIFVKTDGSGSKSNPYTYSIQIEYINDNNPTILNFFKGEEKALETFKLIYEKLTENT